MLPPAKGNGPKSYEITGKSVLLKILMPEVNGNAIYLVLTENPLTGAAGRKKHFGVLAAG